MRILPTIFALILVLRVIVTANTLELDLIPNTENGTITATWTTKEPNPKHWIGIYKNTITPSSDHISPLWKYLPNQTKGSLTLTKNLPPDTYSAYLFENDGYSILAGPVTFTIANPSTTKASLIVPETVHMEEGITIKYQVDSIQDNDWIGIYRPNQKHSIKTPSLDWLYLNGKQTPGTAKPTGSITLGEKLDKGDYLAFLFRGDDYLVLAGPHSFSVVDPPKKVLSPWKLPAFNIRPATVGSTYKINLTFYADTQSFQGEYEFKKIEGPDWLKISPLGLATGIPTNEDLGINEFTVQITDSKGKNHQSQINLKVTAQP